MKRPKPLTPTDMEALVRIAPKLPAAIGALLRPYLGIAGERLSFKFDVLRSALKSDDELTRALAEIVCRFGDDKVIDRAVKLSADLWSPVTPAPKRKGAPLQWTDDDKLHAWIAVEAQWRADKKSDPRCTLPNSIRRKFASLPRRGNGKWRIAHDAGSRYELEAVPAWEQWPEFAALRPRLVPGPARHRDLTAETAKLRHQEGAAVLMRPELHPAQRAILNDLADRVAKAIIGARKKTRR